MNLIGEMIASNQLVEGKDFFIMVDANYYTVEALMRIYSCSDSNITQKVAKFGIAKKKVFDRWVYKDDLRFEKGKPGGNNGGKPFVKGDERINKVISHNEISTRVQRIDKQVSEIHSLVTDILDHLTKDKDCPKDQLNGSLDTYKN